MHQDVKLEKTSGSARRPLLTSERLRNEVSAKWTSMERESLTVTAWGTWANTVFFELRKPSEMFPATRNYPRRSDSGSYFSLKLNSETLLIITTCQSKSVRKITKTKFTGIFFCLSVCSFFFFSEKFNFWRESSTATSRNPLTLSVRMIQ